jgi:hypothetical protein
VSSSLLLLLAEREERHTVQRERQRAQSLRINKKVKSNLSGKEKKTLERHISLSLSLSFPFFVTSRDESEKESRDFFHSSRVVVCRSFSGRFLLVLRDESATRFDLFSRRELGPEEGG